MTSARMLTFIPETTSTWYVPDRWKSARVGRWMKVSSPITMASMSAASRGGHKVWTFSIMLRWIRERQNSERLPAKPGRTSTFADLTEPSAEIALSLR